MWEKLLSVSLHSGKVLVTLSAKELHCFDSSWMGGWLAKMEMKLS